MLISDYKHIEINILATIGTQQVRKIKQDIFFMYKLLNGIIYCLDLLSKLAFFTSWSRDLTGEYFLCAILMYII